MLLARVFRYLPCLVIFSAPSAWAQQSAIPGTEHLAVGKTPGAISGTILVEPLKGECEVLFFETDLVKNEGPFGWVEIDPDSPGGIGSMKQQATITTQGGIGYGLLWATDVLYEVSGTICLPTEWWQSVRTGVQLSYASTEGGSMAMTDGRLVSSTPVTVKGYAAMRVPDEVSTIRVVSDPDSPMQFLMTPEGLVYQSGGGTVTLPDGTELEY